MGLDNTDSPIINKYACIIYIVVIPEFRGEGIAQKLYLEAEKRTKEAGMTHVYSWANSEGKGEIVQFFKKNGLAKGHKYIWMDKKI